jgi:hypothetical protein
MREKTQQEIKLNHARNLSSIIFVSSLIHNKITNDFPISVSSAL